MTSILHPRTIKSKIRINVTVLLSVQSRNQLLRKTEWHLLIWRGYRKHCQQGAIQTMLLASSRWTGINIERNRNIPLISSHLNTHSKIYQSCLTSRRRKKGQARSSIDSKNEPGVEIWKWILRVLDLVTMTNSNSIRILKSMLTETMMKVLIEIRSNQLIMRSILWRMKSEVMMFLAFEFSIDYPWKKFARILKYKGWIENSSHPKFGHPKLKSGNVNHLNRCRNRNHSERQAFTINSLRTNDLIRIIDNKNWFAFNY